MRAFESDWQANVLCFGGQMSHPEPERISAEFFDDIQWVDAVALGLGHRFAEPVQDFRVDVNLIERNLAGVVQ